MLLESILENIGKHRLTQAVPMFAYVRTYRDRDRQAISTPAPALSLPEPKSDQQIHSLRIVDRPLGEIRGRHVRIVPKPCPMHTVFFQFTFAIG
jgi:hypothetical protein